MHTAEQTKHHARVLDRQCKQFVRIIFALDADYRCRPPLRNRTSVSMGDCRAQIPPLYRWENQVPGELTNRGGLQKLLGAELGIL